MSEETSQGARGSEEENGKSCLKTSHETKKKRRSSGGGRRKEAGDLVLPEVVDEDFLLIRRSYNDEKRNL